MRKWVWLSITLAALSTGYAAGYFVKTPPGAGGMTVAGVPMPPPVKAYSEGGEIRFAHTEASDTKVAKLLTEMMRSPVLVVPALAQAPPTLLATVYVFKNGVRGGGPFKYQPDVFDNPPGSDGYRPLRAVALVTWKSARAARVLKSEREVKAAEQAGEIMIERPSVVVNMPLVTWPGGSR